ncbi:MAG: DUF1571 domain-containing protein [Planctomycetales bacterium]|nr:DUF1571 domain-containing protein [Planctomycetales bacterium]
MRRTTEIFSPRIVALLVAAAGMATHSSPATAEPASRFTQPIYRVALEESAEKTPQLASRIAVAAPAQTFDLTQRPGEHPLMPALRMAKDVLQDFDANVADYSAILRKQERIGGELGEEEIAYVKVRNKPFAVHMYFLRPHKGRECLYNDGPGGAKGVLVARDCGWKRRIGAIELDPEGTLAMKGQKYPIMKLGLRNLTTELIDVANNDVNFGECEVVVSQNKINDRPVTQLVVTHPTPRRNFRFHKAEVFIDNELRVPIRYAAYMWPERPGSTPPLEEAYTYLNLKINNGFTDADFSKDNPEIFK